MMANIIQQALRGYKWLISPLLPAACRYVPTCSEYAAEAVTHHGVLRGGVMALGRLLRCHPLARGGFDPVRVSPASCHCIPTRPELAADSEQPLI